jgi:tRNA-2-methylthio-N6-dimethylallyladenosine synthase
LNEIITLQRQHSALRLQAMVGKTYAVLIEGFSKKSNDDLSGRTTHNAFAVFPKENYKKGDYVDVYIEKTTSGTLIGKAIGYSKNV